jgi:polyisoprenoid-binding protein YceI
MFSMLLSLALSASAATWEVDAAHSTIGFSVTHMSVSTVRGVFGTVNGTIEYDPANVAASKFTGTVATASVDTNNAERDGHLKNADFFDVVKFPEMKFASKSVRNVTTDAFEVVGDLTIHGITKEVVFKVKKPAPAMVDPWGATKSGTTATATINRKDFGVSWNKQLDTGGWVVSDEVAVELLLELKKK